MSDATFVITGVDKFERDIERLARNAGRSGVLGVIRKGANVVKRHIRSETPVGPTGNLRGSIQSKTLPGLPPSIVVRTRFKKGPHVHLVTSGTVERFRRRVYSNLVFRRILNIVPPGGSTGKMPSNDFIHRGARSAIPSARRAMERELERLLEL